jgi:hypothetical protein
MPSFRSAQNDYQRRFPRHMKVNRTRQLNIPLGPRLCRRDSLGATGSRIKELTTQDEFSHRFGDARDAANRRLLVCHGILRCT